MPTEDALRQLRADEGTGFLPLPMLVAADGRTAEFRMGMSADRPDVIVKVVPSSLDDGTAMAREIHARLEGVDPIEKSTMLAMRSGQTAVGFQGRRERR